MGMVQQQVNFVTGILFLHIAFVSIAQGGVFKCVVDGNVSYSSAPCAAGAVPYQSGSRPVVGGASAPTSSGADGDALDGSINNQPAKFYVDTSVPYTTISPAVAQRLGLLGCAFVGDMTTKTGKFKYCVMTIGNLDVAGQHVSHADVLVRPLQEVDAIIGSDIWGRLEATGKR